MKIEKNNVKIEITETKNDKICIDITTSKEVVVNVYGEDGLKIDLTETKMGLVDTVERGEANAAFDLTDVVIRDPQKNKEQQP